MLSFQVGGETGSILEESWREDEIYVSNLFPAQVWMLNHNWGTSPNP